MHLTEDINIYADVLAVKILFPYFFLQPLQEISLKSMKPHYSGFIKRLTARHEGD
jgi:hypothetical protein